MFCPGTGVTNHTAPWKRSGSEPSTPVCSFPAMGCPPRKRLAVCLPKAAQARGHNFCLGAAHIGEQSLRGKRRPEPSDQLNDCADRGGQQHNLASLHCLYRIGMRIINRAGSRARFNTGARSQPTMRPLKACFFNASPKEPPMRPVPMMVIWRIGMGMKSSVIGLRVVSSGANLPKTWSSNAWQTVLVDDKTNKTAFLGVFLSPW